MKKYLTAAALLAAGTAFANAASLVAQWNDFSDLVSDQGSTLLSVSTGTGGASLVGDGTLSVASVATSAARASVDLTSASITGAGFTLVMTFSGFSNGENQVIADMVYDGTGSASGEKGYGFGRGNSNNNAWCLNREGTLLRNNTEYWSIEPDTGEHTAVLTFDATGNVELYIDNVIRQRAAVSNTYVSADTAFPLLVLGGYGDYNGAASSYSLSKMAIYDGVLAASDVTSGNVYAAIPEPSAFGLIAGAGALALVASRRRRRAK